MNDLILSVFLTIITGQQPAPLNADCDTIIKKEKEDSTKDKTLTIEKNSISIIDNHSKTAKIYSCGSKYKSLAIFAPLLTKEKAFYIYNHIYTASVQQYGNSELDSKHLKSRVLTSIIELTSDKEFQPYAQWDIEPNNRSSLSILKTNNNNWTVTFTISANKRVNCGGPVEFKACKKN